MRGSCLPGGIFGRIYIESVLVYSCMARKELRHDRYTTVSLLTDRNGDYTEVQWENSGTTKM